MAQWLYTTEWLAGRGALRDNAAAVASLIAQAQACAKENNVDSWSYISHARYLIKRWEIIAAKRNLDANGLLDLIAGELILEKAGSVNYSQFAQKAKLRVDAKEKAKVVAAEYDDFDAPAPATAPSTPTPSA